MNSRSAVQQIHLVIANPEVLEYGSRPSHVFDTAGGTIGSRGANWQLTDARGGVAPIHAEIIMVDGAYCLVDRSGNTWFNQNQEPLGPGRIIRVNDGDVMRIGPYRIGVNLDQAQHELIDQTRHLGQQGLGEILNERESQFDRLPVSLHSADHHQESELPHDELAAFTQPLRAHGEVDPMVALDAAAVRLENQRTASGPIDRTHYGLSNRHVMQTDLAETNLEAVSNVTLQRGVAAPMDKEQHVSRPSQPWRESYEQSQEQGRHIAAIPLEQGLGVKLGGLDSEQAHQLLYETGRSLKAAIEGIAALYRQSPQANRGMNLLSRTLQPIEDNPLRLQQGYDDTVQALFSAGRSPVHLAPQAAFSESLEQIARHNEAMVEAVNEGLKALLRAFSPRVLEKRFERYGGNDQGNPDEGWLWSMYCHYFNEIVSSRQQGFDKLFWEVFDQAYDRSMRSGV